MIDFPEQWKQYDKNYWVSDLGRVKRVYKNGREHILTPVKRAKNDTSLRVKLNNKYVSIRRLVWQTFKGDIPDGYGVVNKNGCYTMNEIYNLKLLPLGQCKGNHKSTRRKFVVNLDTGLVYPSIRESARRLNICYRTAWEICAGKIKKSKYHLEFYDENKRYNKMIRFIR